MRMALIAVGIAFAVTSFVALSEPASAAKSKMGCEIGKEVWNATLGKCEAGTSKYKRKTAAKPAKKAPAKK